MRTQNQQDLDKAPVYTRSHGHGGIVFMSTIAFVSSILSLLVSGFLAYRFLDLREEFRNSPLNSGVTLPNANNSNTPSTNQTQINQEPGQETTASTERTATSSTGQLVQPAISNKAQVELLSVDRVQNPATNTRDIVKVQFRVSRVTSQPVDIEYSEGLIYSEQTTARNSKTGAIYRAVNPNKTANTISVKEISPDASTIGSVSLKVPEGITTLDISIPKTETFVNISIPN